MFVRPGCFRVFRGWFWCARAPGLRRGFISVSQPPFRGPHLLCRRWHRGVSFYPRLYLIVCLAFELASLDIRSSYVIERSVRRTLSSLSSRESIIESRNRKGATGVLRVAEESRDRVRTSPLTRNFSRVRRYKLGVCYRAIGDPATTGGTMVRDAEVPTRVTW